MTKEGSALRIAQLRQQMEREGIDAYYVVTDDYHASEYVGDYFKEREYLSGFDGSAGELVVTQEEACLWTDGRYFLQAAEQLEGTGIKLMKMREPGVPTVPQYLAQNLTEGQTVGYDGRTVSNATAEAIEKACKSLHLAYRTDLDLVDRIWEDRPALSAEKVWELSDQLTGETRAQKLSRVREYLKKHDCNAHLIASLDDIAWLYQLRGGDVDFNPVFLSYSIVLMDKAYLYANPAIFDHETSLNLQLDGVEIRPYEQVYRDIPSVLAGRTVLLSKSKVNRALYSCIPVDASVVDETSPETLFKACKTKTEVENERTAHIRDGVALTKLIYWLKTQLNGSPDLLMKRVTELDVSDRLLSLRKEQEGFLEQSFAPIVATGAHGAIIHYEPTEATNVPIENNTFLLMDTGGQYLQGTTDVTRTVLLGRASQKMKELYTAVLRGHIRLGSAVFKRGITGVNLDVLARAPLWELGYDYNHGTGHGVGYLLNVHEGPQGIRLLEPGRKIGAPLEEGMITSNEPGIYLAGEFGIRLESLTVVQKGQETDFGQFLQFETLTMAPFDPEVILADRLTAPEKAWLNRYHETVRNTLAPYLTAEENAWLAEVTQPLP